MNAMSVARCIALVAVAACAAPTAQTPAAGRIAGRVLDTAGRPLPGATVTLQTRPAGGDGVTTTSDADGRFAFERPEPGVFTLSAALDDHVETEYGARTPGEPGTPVRLHAGQHVVDLQIVLPAHGAITGRVRDANGDPPKGAMVEAFPIESGRFEPRLRAVAGETAAPDGTYSLDGLVPGEYVVSARSARVMRRGSTFRVIELFDPHVRTFHPASLGSAGAAVVTVVPGATAGGIDIRLGDYPSSSFELLLRAPVGPVGDVRASIRAADAFSSPPTTATFSARTSASSVGYWRSTDLVAGRYEYVASARVGGRLWWAFGEVHADGVTPLRVEAALQPSAAITGVVRFHDAEFEQVYPGLRLVGLDDRRESETMPRFQTVPFASGEFEMLDVAPGRYVLTTEATTAIDGRWRLHSVTIDGQDRLDLPFDLVAGQTVRGVQIALTTRTTTLRGRVLDEEDERPRTDVTLVVFPADARYRWPGSRRIVTTRPDTSGAFEVTDLPSGDYLVAAAGGPIRPAPDDIGFVEDLAAGATPVSLSVGEPSELVVRVR